MLNTTSTKIESVFSLLMTKRSNTYFSTASMPLLKIEKHDCTSLIGCFHLEGDACLDFFSLAKHAWTCRDDKRSRNTAACIFIRRDKVVLLVDHDLGSKGQARSDKGVGRNVHTRAGVNCYPIR